LTLDALGLTKMNKVVEHNATPQILGMVKKIQHLITVVEK
jgi:large subunit ribosomal protein L30